MLHRLGQTRPRHGTPLPTPSCMTPSDMTGDTIACDILREAWKTPGSPDDGGQHDVRACGRENIEVLWIHR